MSLDPASVAKPKLAYNLKEAAAATGYSVDTLRIAIRRNDLVARYANSRPIILADELLDWLRSLPTEPKGGHRPLSLYGEDVEGWPGLPDESAVKRVHRGKPDDWWTEAESDPFR